MVTTPITFVGMYLHAASRKELHVMLLEISAISVLSCVFCIVCVVQLFEFFNCCQVLKSKAKKATSFRDSQVTSKQLSTWKLWLSVQQSS